MGDTIIESGINSSLEDAEVKLLDEELVFQPFSPSEPKNH